jgi:hypothetical protein
MKDSLKKITGVLGIILLPIICGILGALGGAENSNKAFRRWLIPLALSGFAYVQLENAWVFTIMGLTALYSLGYGIPSPDDPKPSILGKFFYDLVCGNLFWANVLTRTSIGIFVSLCYISIPMIQKNWKTYLVCSIGIILVNALLSWKDLGVYEFAGRKLLWSETILYGLTSLFGVIITLIRW